MVISCKRFYRFNKNSSAKVIIISYHRKDFNRKLRKNDFFLDRTLKLFPPKGKKFCSEEENVTYMFGTRKLYT